MVVRNRALRVVVAALAAWLVSLFSVGALAFLLIAGLMAVAMPEPYWAAIFVGGLLIVVFGLTFRVCFREMLGKLTPQ